MPLAAIGIGLGTAIAGGAAAGATVYGAHKTASAAKNSAKLQTDAANHAADVEAASARETLDFTKQEAQRKAAADEADRKGNYDQWAAFMSAHNAARAKYGYSETAIPGYVPGVTPTPKNGSPGAALMGPPQPPMTGNGAPPLASNPNTGVINPRSVGSLLMPGVPPGSTPVNGGINPNAWTYQTPDGRVVRGMRTPQAPMASRSVGASLYGGR